MPTEESQLRMLVSEYYECKKRWLKSIYEPSVEEGTDDVKVEEAKEDAPKELEEEYGKELMDVIHAFNKIQDVFLNTEVVEIKDKGLRATLRKLRERKGDPIDQIISSMWEGEVEANRIGYLFDVDEWNDSSRMTLRRYKMGSLFVNTILSEKFENVLSELTQVFASGAFDAAVVFCRALLESTLMDTLGKRYPETRDKVVSFKEKEDKGERLFRLINEARDLRVLTPKLAQEAHRIRLRGNVILHGQAKRITEREALHFIHSTFVIVEELT